MDDYEMDEAESFGLGGLYPEEQGEETVDITSAASRGALMFGAPEIQARYGEAVKEYEESTAAILDQLTRARNKLLNQPTEKSKEDQLRGLAMALAAPREKDDPRFYERRNLYTFLRDIGEYGAKERESEKESKLKREEEIRKIEENLAKARQQSALGLIQKLEPSFRQSIKPAAAVKQHPDVERITQLTELINTSKDPEVIKIAKRNLDAIGRDNPQAMSRFAQIEKAVEMMDSSNPKIAAKGRQIYAALKSGGGAQQLTVAQRTKDKEIKKDRDFVSKLTKKEIDDAYLMRERGTKEQQEIVRRHKNAQKLTYEEGGMEFDNDEDVIEEEMP